MFLEYTDCQHKRQSGAWDCFIILELLSLESLPDPLVPKQLDVESEMISAPETYSPLLQRKLDNPVKITVGLISNYHWRIEWWLKNADKKLNITRQFRSK